VERRKNEKKRYHNKTEDDYRMGAQVGHGGDTQEKEASTQLPQRGYMTAAKEGIRNTGLTPIECDHGRAKMLSAGPGKG